MSTPSAPPPRIQIGPLIELAPGQLKPWPDNARKHPKYQLTKLMASMSQFGFTIPLLVDEANVVLSGHGRLEAAKGLGLPAVPVRVITGLTQSEKRAYVLADNKLAQLSSWDAGLLKSEMDLLIQDDFEIELTGFSTAEVDLLYVEPAHNADDLQPQDVVEETVSIPGDLWVMGAHRVLCGDALAASSYTALMGTERFQMCLTDPPYNVPIDGHVCGSGKVKHREFAMASGELSSAQFTSFLEPVLRHVQAWQIPGAISFVAMDWRHMPELLNAARPVFGEPKQLCVWVKDNAGMGTFYRSQHELFFAFKNGDAPHINNFELGQHGRYRTNVWSYPGVNGFTGKGLDLLALHPTVKPVSLFADAIRDCSHRKGLIVDPFAGSGTIVIACERTGRCARAIELDPLYVDVAVRRWQRLTGRTALLQATGQTWDEVRAGRARAGEAA